LPDAPEFISGDAAFTGELDERRIADLSRPRRFFKMQPRCHADEFSLGQHH
jgi:hypothetical protein